LAGSTKKKGNTGKRYTDDQKKEILDFVRGQGRGGITAATRKYGVSYIALARWMKGKGGGKPGRKPGRPPKAGKADGRTKKRVATALAAFKGLKKQFTALQKAMKALK